MGTGGKSDPAAEKTTMKKTILAAVAAGALAIGGAAGAQDLGDVLTNILGFGQPNYGAPAVVAGTQYQSVYTDQYGRQVGIDQNGNQVVISGSNRGRCGIVGHDAYGQPIYGPTRYGGLACPGTAWGFNGNRDRDGDGVADARDRWPDNRRYW
jgi:hypothetical protein